jgi:hypothetical protein
LDVFEKSWLVVFTHLLEGVVPKLFVLTCIETDVVLAVPISSGVIHPHIIPIVSQYEGKRVLLPIEDPISAGTKQPMLKDNHRLTDYFLASTWFV